MYESFYQFSERPFVASPLANRYFPGGRIEDARQRLTSAIERAAGPGMVVGPTGCGKTLLCHVIAEQFRNQLAIVQLESARLCTRRALLQSILFELGLPYRDLDEGALRLSLMDHLSPSEACPNGMLLLVDEAHTLPERLLEEIRMITNLVRDGQPRVRLVLAGSPALEEQFAHPRFESFNQRLATRSYLEPFNATESRQFVLAQVAASSGTMTQVFDDEALSAIFRATDGIPRLINQLCDHALVLGFASGTQRLSAAQIEEAWADLQQLPTPWTEETGTGTSENGATEDGGPAAEVIEFGTLEDEPLTEGFMESSDPAACESAALTPPGDHNSCELDDCEIVEAGEVEVGEMAQPDTEASVGASAAVPFPVVNFPVHSGLSQPTLHELQELQPTDSAQLESGLFNSECGVNSECGECNPDLDDDPNVLSAKSIEVAETDLATNPFEEQFAEEELVIDDFATLGETALRDRKQVETARNPLLAAALSQAQLPLLAPLPKPEAPAPGPTPIAIDHDDPYEVEPSIPLDLDVVRIEDEPSGPHCEIPNQNALPADYDPVLPESDPFGPLDKTSSMDVVWDNLVQDIPTTCSEIDDDRDILVIEDEPLESADVHPEPEVRRQEYRQLFSNLRRC